MDYHAHYDRLITRAKGRQLEGYSERHHVVPKCLGGSDDPENIVRLTGSEHFVAHLLLVKMHPENPSLAYAAYMMTVKSRAHNGNRSRNKLYGWLRQRISSEAKKRTGERNGGFGTRWITDGVNNQKIGKTDLIPEGWDFGRSLPQLMKVKPKRYCQKCGIELPARGSLCRVHLREHFAQTSKKVKAWLGKRYITDGVSDKRHDPNNELPSGWRYGRTNGVKRP